MTDPRKSAVILVDMANEFIEPGYFIADAGGPDYQARAKAILAPLKTLVEGARKAGALVVYSTDAHTPDDLEMRKWPPHSMKGTKSAEIVPELAMQPGDLDIPTAIVPPATTEIAEESSVPRLSKDLQAALARVRRRNKPAATAKETPDEASPDEASPEAATEPEPEAAPRKDSRQRRRERRASRRWGNDSPELVELYRAALAQLDPEP